MFSINSEHQISHESMTKDTHGKGLIKLPQKIVRMVGYMYLNKGKIYGN